jgi:hypothetical protein
MDTVPATTVRRCPVADRYIPALTFWFHSTDTPTPMGHNTPHTGGRSSRSYSTFINSLPLNVRQYSTSLTSRISHSLSRLACSLQGIISRAFSLISCMSLSLRNLIYHCANMAHTRKRVSLWKRAGMPCPFGSCRKAPSHSSLKAPQPCPPPALSRLRYY